GVTRFLNRTWALVTEPAANSGPTGDGDLKELRRAVHHAIREVTEDLRGFSFNTAIAELMTLLNVMVRAKSTSLVETAVWREAIESLLLLLAPIAPHITEELWERSGHEGSVHDQSWPGYDETALDTDSINMAVQVNGKLRGQITVPADADEVEVLASAKAEHNVSRYLEGSSLVREIVVPGRLVNLVVKPNG
ncbi:MAG: class I tRNA ligase family protein, partial [Truepera sp.]|nr:class I tRNA ligase family protein [Truepera sp.]